MAIRDIRGGRLNLRQLVSKTFRPPNIPLRGEIIIETSERSRKGEVSRTEIGTKLRLRSGDLEQFVADANEEFARHLLERWEIEWSPRWPVRTGASKAAMRFNLTDTRRGWDLTATNPLAYAVFVEFGTRFIRPGHYLRDAFAALDRDIRQGGRMIASHIDTAAKRQARRRLVQVDRRV